MTHTDIERWSPLAAQIVETRNPLRLPFHILMGEAVGCAKFMKERWAPRDGLPGLSRLGRAKLPWLTYEELLSLARAVQEVQTRYLLAVELAVDLAARARVVVDRLESAVAFLLDDEVVEAADLKLAQLKEEHAQSREYARALPQMLSDYAALAESLRDRLVEMDEGFDPAVIDEAKALAGQLLQSGVDEPPESEAARDLRILRNRLLVLLSARVRMVRSGAAYVFGEHPEVAREATSAYERKRRAQARARAKEAAAKKATEESEAPAGAD